MVGFIGVELGRLVGVRVFGGREVEWVVKVVGVRWVEGVVMHV